MLRISLIIAIVAGLAAAGLNFYKVREVLVTTISERDNEKNLKETEMAEHRSTKKTLSQTQETLASTEKKLETTTANLKRTTATLATTEARAAELDTKLLATTQERNQAQQKLSQWDILDLQPDQVRGMIADLKKAREHIEVVGEENRLLARKKLELENKLAYFHGDPQPVELPEGLKGSIIAVDPKYDFVVLNIGKDKGVLERGEMLINRNGKLVGKVRIAAVQENQCVANIIPAWKQDEVMEGDQVLY
ncbi:MAG: hypothetical protein H0X66_12680 [Verrucomicrobia bacterium]|nr:hypothetical protein [Verrucomicrobiota bacterium]